MGWWAMDGGWGSWRRQSHSDRTLLEDVDRIVLLQTMALTYEPLIMRQLQANDTILERLAVQAGVGEYHLNTAWLWISIFL